MDEAASERLVKSKKRVVDHGEVFTPSWMVDEMLDLVKFESERIDSRFLEPACGSGNFLNAVLIRKLQTVGVRYGKSEFERRHYALFALMSIYGIELLADNTEDCRRNLLLTFVGFLGLKDNDVWADAARKVLRHNVIQGDAITLKTATGDPIEFPEWSYLGGGKFQRRDFRYESLTQRASFEGTLFEMLEEHELFIPTKTYEPMTVSDIAS